MVLQLLACVGVLAVLTMVPGPDMAVVTRRAVASDWQDGMRTVGGIVIGLLAWGVLTVAGLTAMLAASATAYTVVKVVGAASLVFLGVQALLHSRTGHGDAHNASVAAPTGNPWRTGVVSNMLNPKIAVFYTGLLPSLAPPALSPHVGMILLVLLHVVLTLAWLGAYVVVLAKAQQFFARPVVRRTMARITGTVLIGFGIKVATSSA
ncbi:MAG: LysE family translocator [Rhodococcus sp.]|nr:LysE family translocator [Rhodococcus sp. (in: high G+C Gram-positive bacteria)]